MTNIAADRKQETLQKLVDFRAIYMGTQFYYEQIDKLKLEHSKLYRKVNNKTFNILLIFAIVSWIVCSQILFIMGFVFTADRTTKGLGYIVSEIFNIWWYIFFEPLTLICDWFGLPTGVDYMLTIVSMFIVPLAILIIIGLLCSKSKDKKVKYLQEIEKQINYYNNQIHNIYLATNQCVPENLANQIDGIINALTNTSAITVEDAIILYQGAQIRR